MKPHIALIAATYGESDRLEKALSDRNRKSIRLAGKRLIKAKHLGRDVLLMNSGVGKVNAAHAATLLFENYSVNPVVAFGIGGAYPYTMLYPGDIAIADREIYGDEGVITLKGWKGLKDMGFPSVLCGRKRFFNEFSMDMKLVKKADNVAAAMGLNKKVGPFVTVSTCTGTAERAVELAKRFNAICENMEGAAIAHICTIYGVPMIEIRGISNIATDRDTSSWDLRLASENCQKVVFEFLKGICSRLLTP